jgi:hypothetical protein
MKELKRRIAKVDSEIASAKKHKEQQEKRIKVKRSYKADTTTNEASLKSTKAGIAASKAQREALEGLLRVLKADKE